MSIISGGGKYFYDSFAVIEYLNGNQKYRHYIEDANGVITKLNLMEIYSKVLKIKGPKAAKEVLNSFSAYLIDFDLSAIEGAMKLRLNLIEKKRLDLSYSDALGYYLSMNTGRKFLTGDLAFEHLENVEFVR